jgi:hypothetical protein
VKKVEVTLGGDPEFELVVDGDVVPAEKVLAEEAIVFPWGVIGEDGSGDPIELRPQPSADPEVLVRNLGRLLLSVPGFLGGVPSTAGKKYPIGGHIHIGGVPSEVQEDLVEFIDGFLGDFFHSLSSETRLKTGYGRRGDWRPQPWGVEYRTPPASVWSHPEVALTFLRAIKWVAEKFLSGEKPMKSPVWPLVRASAEKATEFVRNHKGMLHWGAWKAHIGDLWEVLEVKVSLGPETEHDGEFLEDLRAMCVRLGIPSLNVIPLVSAKGDYASNVPGYGDFVEGYEPYRPGGDLALSWRFRNAPEFRKAEMPRMERAIAELLFEKDDDHLLVREAVPFSAEWPLEVEAENEEAEEELRVPGGEGCVCDGCGAQIEPSQVYWAEGRVYCRECYEEEFTSCRRCGCRVRQESAHYDRNRRAYCEECYHEVYATCYGCEEEVAIEGAWLGLWGEIYCSSCYEERYTRCAECDRKVERSEVEERNDLPYCPSCYASLFDPSEEEGEVALRG